MTSDDLREMQALAQENWRRQPEYLDSDTTVGELAWSWGIQHGDAPGGWTHRIFREGGRTLAWGWIYRANLTSAGAHAATLVWQLHPDHPKLLTSVLDWFEAEVPDGARATSVRSANDAALGILQGRGYEAHDGPFDLRNERELFDPIEAPELPSGYRLRTMEEVGDLARRVELHRAAWHPSQVTVARYRDLVQTWPYRADTDCLVEAPEGALAAYALAWYDADNRVGEFEPVGTHPDHRGLGLGRAVCLFGLERLRELGAERALVGCRGDDAYPVPKRLYRSVGFRELSRQVPLRLRPRG